MVVLAVPLAMLSSENGVLFGLGGMLIFPVLFGCIAYLVGRWKGVLVGLLTALIAMWVILVLFFIGVY